MPDLPDDPQLGPATQGGRQAGSAAKRVRRDDQNARCTKCGAGFRCGAVGAESHCWCFDLPTLATLEATTPSCYCPRCLTTLTKP
ncbi:MAG: cysteine-rich CWC family protein [Rhodocyclaceae bacterium]|nr:cysteine-rich CWC family protein [Rhodocyclaceae bacterium]